MRYAVALIGLFCTLCVTACGEERRHAQPGARPTAAPAVPDLYDANLDDAEERLDELGISYTVDSGDDEVVFEHLWTVCDQWPEPGTRARVVELTVEHVCDD
jgi:PASTA domain